jgi:hypothetical protein
VEEEVEGREGRREKGRERKEERKRRRKEEKKDRKERKKHRQLSHLTPGEGGRVGGREGGREGDGSLALVPARPLPLSPPSLPPSYLSSLFIEDRTPEHVVYVTSFEAPYFPR